MHLLKSCQLRQVKLQSEVERMHGKDPVQLEQTCVDEIIGATVALRKERDMNAHTGDELTAFRERFSVAAVSRKLQDITYDMMSERVLKELRQDVMGPLERDINALEVGAFSPLAGLIAKRYAVLHLPPRTRLATCLAQDHG